VWRLDFEAMESLLRDFFETDYWQSSNRRRRARSCTS